MGQPSEPDWGKTADQKPADAAAPDTKVEETKPAAEEVKPETPAVPAEKASA